MFVHLTRDRSMVSSLVKVVGSNLMTPKSVILLRPVAAAASRLLSTYLILNDLDPFDNYCYQNVNGQFCSQDIRRVREVLKDAYCPRLLATRNLARLLNLMEERALMTRPCGPSGCLRWDVMEDTTALYLIRDMSQMPKKEMVKEFYNGSCIFYNVRVIKESFQGIRIIVGREDPNPGFQKPGYMIDLYLPFCRLNKKKGLNVTMDEENDILKVTIPKKTKEMIRSFSTQLKFYE